MKKGFTLIELLAVIIILAVIALITTPVVLNIIDNAKREADKASANGILDAAKLYYAEMYLENKGSIPDFECTFSGNSGCTELSLTGTLPKTGAITISKNGTVNGRLEIEKNIFYICNSKVLENEDETCDYTNYELIYAITNDGMITGFKLKEETSYIEIIPVVNASELTDDATKYLQTKNITIPEYIGNTEVNGIASNAFSNYDISEVTILSNKVITIEENSLPSTLTKLKVKSCYASGYDGYSSILEEIPTDCKTQEPTVSYKCIRADVTTLHTETCKQTSLGCYAAGYTGNNKTITYGNKTITPEHLTSGDAFDCDVNGDGTYDSVSERFYYVSDLSSNTEYAVLIYYNNTIAGVANNTSSGLLAYNSSNKNYQGPVTAINNLPTIVQWKNVSLTNESKRAITTPNGVTSTSGGALPTAFSYSKTVNGEIIPLAARFLTYQEVQTACGTGGEVSSGYLDKCSYLLENTKYSSNTMGTNGYWLETPYRSNKTYVYDVNYSSRALHSGDAKTDAYYGVRPAIEVLKTDIEY